MQEGKFLLLDLKEEQPKSLAQVMSNDTSRKILDFLADKEATESQIAEKMNLPISTIHYNLQQLVKSGLVVIEEFHYSKKGKEMNHYKLANKIIIISPKNDESFKEKLKSILPVSLIAFFITGCIYLYNKLFSTVMVQSAAKAPEVALMAERAMPSAESPAVMDTTQQIAQTGEHNLLLYFLLGCVFTIVLFVIVEYIIHKIRKSKK